MISVKPHLEESDPRDAAMGTAVKVLQISFCALVLALSVFQFSENTADPDLWGHIVYGQEMLHSGTIPKADIYSWTARGQPWINHEWLAEVSLGAAHEWLGGSGVLLLKMVIGLLTFALALRLGINRMAWPNRLAAWGLAALAVVEISYGFAARPQVFTALFLVLELMLLRRIHAGSYGWAAAVPLLFVVWINTHGGVFAGLGLLGLAAGVTTLQFMFRRILPCPAEDCGTAPKRITVLVLWTAFAGAAAALFCNPWKGELLRWLIGSILWLRPEIAEWNPTPLGWDHAVFFILLALGAFAWVFTRRSRTWWELAACAAFAVLGWRALRNAPLCAIVFLGLMPPHLADALGKFRRHFARSLQVLSDVRFQKFLTALFVCAAVAIGVATFTLHKEHPFTMEVPASQYPISAIGFLEQNQLRGKMLVFFDWGEMVIFHLPNCPVSLDGRLDTCYSRELIAAHWKFCNAEPFDKNAFNPDEADLALMPSKLAAVQALASRPGWRLIYFDETAAILAKDFGRFPTLAHRSLPLEGSKTASLGRAAFAEHNPRWR